MESQTRKTLTVAEAAKALGVSRGSAYALTREGRIPAIRLGKRLIIPKVAFEKFLADPAAQNPAA